MSGKAQGNKSAEQCYRDGERLTEGRETASIKQALENRTCALIRLEQLYPFPEADIKACLDRYQSAQDIVWIQEEFSHCEAAPFSLRPKSMISRRITPAAASHEAYSG